MPIGVGVQFEAQHDIAEADRPSRSTPSVPRASHCPSAITRPPRSFTPIAVAIALTVTPAQATSASPSGLIVPACKGHTAVRFRPWPKGAASEVHRREDGRTAASGLNDGRATCARDPPP